MSLVTLVGNPREGSRTRVVAERAAAAIAQRAGYAGEGAGPGTDGRGGSAHDSIKNDVVDLAGLATGLFGPPDPDVQAALGLVAAAKILVVASPTYKGTYTGLLKSFLDRLPGQALAGTVALPLLVMGDPRHALAVEVHLRPLLVELGATVPTPGLAVLESEIPELDEVVGRWADRLASQLPLSEGIPT
jgi:FMN reductase